MSSTSVSSLTIQTADAVIVDVSHGFCLQYGWQPQALLGQSLLQLCWPDSAAYQRLLLTSLNQHTVRHFAASWRNQAGDTCKLSLIATPLQGAQGGLLQLLVLPAEAMPQSPRLAQQMNSSVPEDCAGCPIDRFHNLFHSHNAPFLLVDPAEGVIADANAAARGVLRLSGRARCWACRCTRINILTPQQMAEERATALLQQRNYFVFPHRLCSGEIRTVEVHSSPVEVGGSHLAVFGGARRVGAPPERGADAGAGAG
jgi:PAS domain S-box-containing protein